MYIYYVCVFYGEISYCICLFVFFFSSRRRHTRCALVTGSSDVCSSDQYDQILRFAYFDREKSAPSIFAYLRNFDDTGNDVLAFPDLVEQSDIDNRSALARSEEHTSELQSLMRISYAVFCLKKKKTYNNKHEYKHNEHTHKKNK